MYLALDICKQLQICRYAELQAKYLMLDVDTNNCRFKGKGERD